MGLPDGIDVLFVVGVVCSTLGWLFLVIAVATTAWTVLSTAAGDIEYGAFRFCSPITCDTYSSDMVTSSHEAVQAMAILGILCATAGLVVAVIHVVLLVMKKHVTILQLVAGILNCCAFLFFLIAVIIWAADINDAFSTDTDLGYSFALGIVGELFSLAAGIIFIVGWVSGNNGVAP